MRFTLVLKKINLLCTIGVLDQERKKKKNLEIDIELKKDLSLACQLDDLEKTINYDEVIALCQKVSSREYHLIEALAYAIFQELSKTFSPEYLKITVKKRARADIEFAAIVLEKEFI